MSNLRILGFWDSRKSQICHLWQKCQISTFLLFRKHLQFLIEPGHSEILQSLQHLTCQNPCHVRRNVETWKCQVSTLLCKFPVNDVKKVHMCLKSEISQLTRVIFRNSKKCTSFSDDCHETTWSRTQCGVPQKNVSCQKIPTA